MIDDPSGFGPVYMLCYSQSAGPRTSEFLRGMSSSCPVPFSFRFQDRWDSGWEIMEMLWGVCVCVCVCVFKVFWGLFDNSVQLASVRGQLFAGVHRWALVSPSEPWRWAEVEMTRCDPGQDCLWELSCLVSLSSQGHHFRFVPFLSLI